MNNYYLSSYQSKDLGRGRQIVYNYTDEAYSILPGTFL